MQYTNSGDRRRYWNEALSRGFIKPPRPGSRGRMNGSSIDSFDSIVHGFFPQTNTELMREFNETGANVFAPLIGEGITVAPFAGHSEHLDIAALPDPLTPDNMHNMRTGSIKMNTIAFIHQLSEADRERVLSAIADHSYLHRNPMRIISNEPQVNMRARMQQWIELVKAARSIESARNAERQRRGGAVTEEELIRKYPARVYDVYTSPDGNVRGARGFLSRFVTRPIGINTVITEDRTGFSDTGQGDEAGIMNYGQAQLTLPHNISYGNGAPIYTVLMPYKCNWIKYFWAYDNMYFQKVNDDRSFDTDEYNQTHICTPEDIKLVQKVFGERFPMYIWTTIPLRNPTDTPLVYGSELRKFITQDSDCPHPEKPYSTYPTQPIAEDDFAIFYIGHTMLGFQKQLSEAEQRIRSIRENCEYIPDGELSCFISDVNTGSVDRHEAPPPDSIECLPYLTRADLLIASTSLNVYETCIGGDYIEVKLDNSSRLHIDCEEFNMGEHLRFM